MNLIQDTIFDKQDYTTSPLPLGEYDNCTFNGCNFSSANITGIVFTECNFNDCNFSMVNAKGTAFKEVDFKNCKMTGFNFSISDPFLMTMQFTKCLLNLSSFYNLKLKNIRFKKCNLQEVDFVQTDLTNAAFNECDLRNAIFENSILEKADFRSSINYSFDPEQNRIKKAKFSLQGLPGLLYKYTIDIE